MSLWHGMDNVATADNPGELAVVNHWDTFDFALGEQHGNLINGGLHIDCDDIVAHDIAHKQTFLVHFADDVSFSNYADDFALRIDDRQTANAHAVEELGSFLSTGIRVDG